MASYVCTDIHGQWNLWEQIRDYCQLNDTIYFLGDAIDRGKDGLKIMIDMLTDSRVIYLKGNHEDLMYKACMHDLGIERNDFAPSDWEQNGNFETRQSFLATTYTRQLWVLNQIKNMPVKLEVTNNSGQNFLLCHAGASQRNYTFGEFCRFRDDPYLWDRVHLVSKWHDEKNPDWICIHGHTPVQYLTYISHGILHPKNTNEPFIYSKGHKIDLDLGSFESNRIALFNLDTMEYKIFEQKQEENTWQIK